MAWKRVISLRDMGAYLVGIAVAVAVLVAYEVRCIAAFNSLMNIHDEADDDDDEAKEFIY